MGADYRKADKSLIPGCTAAIVGSNVTIYAPPTGATEQAVVGRVRTPVSQAGVIDRLYALVNAAPGAGETFTYTLMVNGLATALTCQIAGAAAVAANDVVNAVPVAQGYDICLRLVTSLNASIQLHKWCFRFTS